MASNYAQVHLSIWSDDDWRELSVGAQHLYLLLLSHPERSNVGVVDWRPKRLRAVARDWAAAQFDRAARELAEARYIIVDEDTEEALVRSFVRNDRLLTKPKMVHSVVRGYRAIASREIRAVVVHELQRLRADQPELRWEVLDEIDDKIMAAPACDPSTYPTGYRALPEAASSQVETVNDTVTRTVNGTAAATAGPTADELQPAQPVIQQHTQQVKPHVETVNDTVSRTVNPTADDPTASEHATAAQDSVKADPVTQQVKPQYETVNDTVTDTVAETVSAHTYTPTHLHTNTPHPRTHARAGASVATIGDQHAAQRPGGRASAADIVNAWKRASGVPVTDSTATGMRLAVSQAMRAGHDEQTIAAGLGAWAQSNISATSQIAGFIDRAALKPTLNRPAERPHATDAWLQLRDQMGA